MSADWKPGDLALCVRSGQVDCPHRENTVHTGRAAPATGYVGEVVAIKPTLVYPDPEACGCYTIHFEDGSLGLVSRFRKIRPHTPDAEDRETVELLNRKPAEVVQ